jgi:heme/copper-type cytochrome/quinol oxidase subunit 3
MNLKFINQFILNKQVVESLIQLEVLISNKIIERPSIISKISFFYWHFVDVMWFCVLINIYFC